MPNEKLINSEKVRKWHKNDCIHRHVCKYEGDGMCPMECGHYENNRQGSLWISVKDGLPDTNEYVLAYVPNSEYKKYSSYVRQGDGYVYCYDDQGSVLRGVTHWQPLPDKPLPEGAKE